MKENGVATLVPGYLECVKGNARLGSLGIPTVGYLENDIDLYAVRNIFLSTNNLHLKKALAACITIIEKFHTRDSGNFTFVAYRNACVFTFFRRIDSSTFYY